MTKINSDAIIKKYREALDDDDQPVYLVEDNGFSGVFTQTNFDNLELSDACIIVELPEIDKESLEDEAKNYIDDGESIASTFAWLVEDEIEQQVLHNFDELFAQDADYNALNTASNYFEIV